MRNVGAPSASVLTCARLLAAAAVIRRLITAARALPPLSTDPGRDVPPISVVIPARDEERRLGPLLDALAGAPGVAEVIVVDDESTDRTAEVARTAGATVLSGAVLPDGWAGKAWALQQGIDAARGAWVVCLDADVRPDPHLPSAAVARAIADHLDLLTVAGRFDCPTPGARWLHPAMLTTLVYRYGAPGWVTPLRSRRVLANGQCMVVSRSAFLDAGGMTPVAGAVVEDVALARHVAATGGRVAMLDGGPLLTTRMFDDLAGTWRGWGRSLALPGVEPPWRLAVDLATVAATLAMPLPRLLARRGDALDLMLVAARLGTLVGTSRAYAGRTAAYWCSPLADVPATLALTIRALRRDHRWRGRHYPRAPRARTAAR